MTTRINVNVDQQVLLQRSREQAQANRLAFLEGQNRSKVSKEAERQRDANRAARGLTADGSMYNNRLRQLPQRPEPAAWRSGLTADIGHAWVEGRITDQASSGSTGLLGGNGASSGYTEPSYARGGKLGFRVRSGNGAILSNYSQSLGAVTPPLPTLGYSNWQTGYSAAYLFYYGWFYGVYGLRTYRVSWENQSSNYILVLPAGRGNCIVFCFKIAYGHTLDITQVVAKEFQKGGGQTLPINFENVKSETDAYFSSFFQPGAYVTNKRNYGYLDQGITDGSGNPIRTAYSWLANGEEVDVSSSGYVPLDPYGDETTNFSPIVSTWGETLTKVYLCSHSTLREITPSSKLQAFIDYCNPPLSTRTITTVGYSVAVPSSNFRIANAGLVRSSNFYTNDGFLDLETGGFLDRATSTWDPRVFQSLNQFWQFTSPNNIIDEDTIRYQVRSDTRSGAYANAPGEDYGFSNGVPYFYGKAKATEADEVIGKRAASVGLSAGNPALEGGQFHRVWDWDRPDYCRQMLFEIGFTTSDLTP